MNPRLKFPIFVVLTLLMLISCTHKKPQEPPVLPVDIDSKNWRKNVSFPFEEKIHFKTIANPKFQVRTLANGIKVHFLHDKNALYTNIRYVVLNDSAHQPLMTELIHGFYSYGSETVRDHKFQLLMRNTGSNFNHVQGPDFSESSIDVLSHDTNLVLKILGDLISRPNFSEKNFAKVKRQVALNNKIGAVIGQQYARRMFFNLIYGEEHPYGEKKRDSDALDDTSLEAIKNYYYSNFLPGEAHIIIAGRINDPESLLNQVKQAFNFKRKKSNFKQTRFKKPTPNHDIYFFHRPHAQQVNIVSGVMAEPKSSSRWFYQSALAKILGGGSHSRLFKDLRETRGLTYSIRASMPPRKLHSPFYISTSCGDHKVAAMLTGIFQHRDFLMNQNMAGDELQFHKNHLLGRLALFRETPSQLAWHHSRQLVFGEAGDALLKYQGQAKALTAKHIQDSAKNLFAKPWVNVIVGDYTRVKEQLEKYFPKLKIKVIES